MHSYAHTRLCGATPTATRVSGLCTPCTDISPTRYSFGLWVGASGSASSYFLFIYKNRENSVQTVETLVAKRFPVHRYLCSYRASCANSHSQSTASPIYFSNSCRAFASRGSLKPRRRYTPSMPCSFFALGQSFRIQPLMSRSVTCL